MSSDLEGFRRFIADGQIKMMYGSYASKEEAQNTYMRIWGDIVDKAREFMDSKQQLLEFLEKISATGAVPDSTAMTVTVLWDIQEGFKQ